MPSSAVPATYVTVAIPYVNADPHLGYAYELVQADVVARSRRAGGDRVRFLGGTDDYSLKNVLAAEAAGEDTREFVARLARRFQALAGPLDLTFDDFIHTSADLRHQPAVERLWRAALERGDLYRRHYEGNYCVGCELFYDDDALVAVDSRAACCPEHRTPTERVAEENWFFRLSRYEAQLEALISSDRLAIRPESFRREALSFIRAGLDDISVSRSVARARGWGIPVPDDPSQTIYVWFDALTNYISALGYGDDHDDFREWWLGADERVHVIGKGILRFHAVSWPAFLLAAGLPVPTRVQVHPYLTVDGMKLSKSSGVTVSPVEIVDRYGTDALRWFFARDVAETADTDFTAQRLIDRANEDLANGLGNATNRIVTLVHRACGGAVREGAEPIAETAGVGASVAEAIRDFRLRDATRVAVEAIDALNRNIDATKPWAIAKDPARIDELRELLARQLATARAVAVAIEPIVPTFAQRLVTQLSAVDGRLSEPRPVFTRLERPNLGRA
ncbi:MAG: methionine--tRNA ligase [Acidimicrobiia bacterium]